MTRVAVLTMVSCCLAASVGFGQAPTAQQPSPELQSLAKGLAGTWSTTYVFAPASATAAPTAGTGEEVWRTGPGGFTLLEEERIATASRKQFILAIQWWDNSTHSLRGMLCNNAGPAACDVDTYRNATLTWDGKQFVVDLRFSQQGKQMMWHEVWSDITPTSFTQTGDLGEAGKPLVRAVTIHATRVAESH